MVPSLRTLSPRHRSTSLTLQTLDDRATPSASPLRVAVIGDGVAQADAVRATAVPGGLAVKFDSDTATWAGLVATLEALSAAHGGALISQLGLVAHGHRGGVTLGPKDTLDLRDVAADSPVWGRLRALLTPDARLDLYACDVAAGRAGSRFLAALAARAGADVVASDDVVGTRGDFVWEYNTGVVHRPDLLRVPALKRIVGLALEDAYEPNDTKAQADVPPGTTSPNLGVLTAQKTLTGLSLDADTEDWFRFELAGVGRYTNNVRLDANQANGDLDLIVYAADGITTVGGDGNGGIEEVRLAGLPPGTYYAQVFPHNSGEGNPSYTLQINPPPAGTDDTYEPNNVKAQADVPPGPNSPNLGVLTAPKTLNNLVMRGNEDWFRFDLAGVGRYTDNVRLEMNQADGDLDLIVYAADGITVVGGDGNGGVEEVRLAGLPPGTYYAQVFPHDYPQNSNPSYTLQVNPPPAGTDDAYEPNNSKGQADVPTGVNSPNLGPVAGSFVLSDLVMRGNTDWFRFSLTQTATAANFVRLETDQADGDLDLVVYKADGVTVVGGDGNGGVEQVSLGGQVAGTYYALVYPHDFPQNSNPSYTLQILAPGSGLTLSAPATITEGDAGTTTATFSVSRSDGTGAASVNYTTNPGTATAGTDYQSTSGTLNFTSGELTKSITVPIVGDTVDEPDETFYVTLSNPVGAILNNQQVTGLIRDDDDAGTIQFSAPTYSVSEAVGMAVVKVTRVGGSDGTVTVQYTTGDATAAAGSDYTTTSGTLTFNTGETSKTILVPIANDTASEPDEFFEMTLSNPTGGAVLGTDSGAEVHIQASDPVPGAFVFSAATYRAPEGAGVLSVTVDRVGGADGPATVQFTTTDKTVKQGPDYVNGTRTLSFADGEASQLFDIDLINDEVFEPDESLILTLSAPSGGATLGAQKSATATILNDDYLMNPKTFVVGAGTTGKVAVIDGTTGLVRGTIQAYPAGFKGGVRVAVGDVTGDGVPDIVTGPGAGAAPQVRVFDGAAGAQLPGALGEFLADSITFIGGLNVAVGDVNGDTRPDIITVPSSGQAPQVKVFSGMDRSPLFDFPAGFASGVLGATVAAADMTNDAKAEIIIGSGPGGPPVVRIFDGATGTLLTGPRGNITAFEANTTGGVSVAAGDVTGDGRAEVFVGAGAGVTARVQGFNGLDATPLYADVQRIVPFGTAFKKGVSVALGQIDGNGGLDLIVGPGKGVAKKVTVFDVATRKPIKTAAPFGATYAGGVTVAGRG